MRQEDIARELGLSKSTVSRALSGKGRIGRETVTRIRNFVREQELNIEENRRTDTATRTLGVVFPNDIYVNGNPYFLECLLGICETTALLDYTTMITVSMAQNISSIQKMVEQKTVKMIFQILPEKNGHLQNIMIYMIIVQIIMSITRENLEMQQKKWAHIIF